MGECIIRVKKLSSDISQFRFDLGHFQLGQPNRRTGVCDTDLFLIGEGTHQEVKICGTNNGQHIYYDVDDVNEPIEVKIIATQPNIYRLWEIRISQIEFKHRAPAGCLQYYREPSGIIQTMNFAVNGRHLADQDYNICMRQETGMCSIAYEPCDENSFKIGPPISMEDDPGSGDDSIPLSDDVGQSRGCQDRVMLPCDIEEFITPGGGPRVCDLLHCGNSFCSGSDLPCRIESSTLPFSIHVQFGPAIAEESPEDNLGMCLKYDQQACVV
ncbi:unnamed protein product [Bemisia tabaci]|uniref:CUB domain-containing protein n=1 Tax=Bemisia tabaci TaxID=7038 RepID=A0A9P0A5S5_BEMTA|nr:unnamed protein product [Bemisia tabaci]